MSTAEQDEIRNQIASTLVVHKKDDSGEPVVEEKKEVKEPEEEEEVIETKEEVETAHEENKEQLEKSEEKQEKLEDQLEDKTLSSKEREKLERRIEKERRKAKDLKAENDALKAKLEANPEKSKILTEDDVEKRARELADQDITEREFINSCNKLADDAVKIDKNFKKKLEAMHDAIEVEGIPPVMIAILEDLDNGGAVLNYLAENEEDAEKIYAMSRNPVKMGVQLTKISNKLGTAKSKAISKVPAPPKGPLGGNGSKQAGFNVTDTKNIQDWVEKRNKDIAEKRANGKFNLR